MKIYFCLLPALLCAILGTGAAASAAESTRYFNTDGPNSPFLAEYKGFPPMLIQVGTDEILESDSEIVYRHALEAGVDATLTRYYGLFHVFQIFGDALPESKHAWEEVRQFIALKFLAPGPLACP